VGPLRDDGFHSVDSFFHLLDLHDELVLTSATDFSFCSTVDLAIPDDDNLVVRAARGMADLYGRQLPPVRLELRKRIPHGAGLGGGSSNAAATIYALSLLWSVRPDDPKHLKLAADLGSDVPLFLAPTTASIMTGRGEALHQSRDPVPGLPILLANPKNAHSSTGAVYRAFDANPQPQHAMPRAMPKAILKTATETSLEATISNIRLDAEDTWKNNLEAAAVAVSPETGDVLTWLRSQSSVELALVAGSGSACGALCATADDADRLSRAVQQKGWWAVAAMTTNIGIHALSSLKSSQTAL